MCNLKILYKEKMFIYNRIDNNKNINNKKKHCYFDGITTIQKNLKKPPRKYNNV